MFCLLGTSADDGSNHDSFGVLFTTAIGSAALLTLIISCTLFTVAITILVKHKAKTVRDLNLAQETANRADYEVVDLNQQGNVSSVISTTDNVAYGHIISPT